MFKQTKNDDSTISETGNWNVADQYTKLKIMKPLILCDYYEDIAYFGYESIIEEIGEMENPQDDLIKIRALKRLIKELIRVIDNTKFAMKCPGTKNTVLGYKISLKKLEMNFPKLTKVVYDNVNGGREIKIRDYALFEKFLDRISLIKSKINEPLNKNHLIFTDKEEFDPGAFKENLKKRMVNQG